MAVLVIVCGAWAGVRAADKPEPASLTGTWVHEDGSTYAIRQDGDEVWWLGKSADNGKGWTNVFHGKIEKNQLTGQWADIPPAANRGSGTITLELVKEGDEVVKLSGKGVNGSIRRTSPPEPEAKPNPLPAELLKVWKEAGAEPYWHHTDVSQDGGSYFRYRGEGFPRELPALRLRRFQAGAAGKLPAPEQPFVLYLDILPEPLKAEDIKALTAFKHLRILCVHESRITPEAMQALGELKQVAHLSLANTPVTDEAAKELAGVKHLKYLNLNGTAVTDAGVKALAAHEGLEALLLRTTKVTDDAAKELARMKQLRRLCVSNTAMTDAGVKELAALTNLEWLVVSNLPVTDDAVKALAPLKGLQFLNLYNTKVTDAGMKTVIGFTELHALDIGSTAVTNAGVKDVLTLKKLKRLNIHGTKVENAIQFERAVPGLKVNW